MTVPKSASRLVWTGVIFLAVIGVAAVTRRTLVLLWPETFAGTASPAAALDAGFAKHMTLTLIHILPGGLFLILAPLQFVPGIRQKHLKVHRWMGRILVLCGLIIGVSALVMSFKMNIGGPNETAATTLYAIVFLFCLSKALPAHPAERGGTASRVDDSRLRDRIGSSDDAPDSRDVFRVSQALAARIFRNRVLVGIHDHFSRGRGVGGVHAATLHAGDEFRQFGP